MIKNFLSLFGSRRNQDKHMVCPECKSRMDIEDISSDSIFEYYEVKRKYKCRKCGKAYDSLELIALNREMESLTNELNRLYDSINTFHSALSILQKAAKKLNEAQKSGMYDGPVMN